MADVQGVEIRREGISLWRAIRRQERLVGHCLRNPGLLNFMMKGAVRVKVYGTAEIKVPSTDYYRGGIYYVLRDELDHTHRRNWSVKPVQMSDDKRQRYSVRILAVFIICCLVTFQFLLF